MLGHLGGVSYEGTNSLVTLPVNHGKLIIKKVYGTGSRDVALITESNVKLDPAGVSTVETYWMNQSLKLFFPEFISYRYLVEEYIPDHYTRVSVDGWVCGDKLGILGIFSNVYHSNHPLKFDYLCYPSYLSDTDQDRVSSLYYTIVNFLRNKTGCDRQIINIEFFVTPSQIKVMEINHRMTVNSMPIYYQYTGYNPFQVSLTLSTGQSVVPNTRVKQAGVCLYHPTQPVNLVNQVLRHPTNQNTWSILDPVYNHTYSIATDVPTALSSAREFATSILKDNYQPDKLTC